MTRLLRYRHDGLVFDVRDEGPLDGDPVVLLHGFPERAATWSQVAGLLNAEGLRTYAPDQRGYSPGARPRRRRDYRLGLLVADVVALAEAIGRPVHLVGHDLGAVVAWYVAAQRPDLVRTLTAASVPHPKAYLRALVTSPQLLKSWYVAGFQVPWLPEWVARTGRMARSLRRGGMTREEAATFRRDILDAGALRGGLGWYRAMALVDRSDLDSVVRVPTTFVWSDGDAFIGRRGGTLVPAYVDAPYRYVELTGVTHWIPTQAPGALADAVLDRIGSV